MRRFRTQWLALFGALVILSLSLGSAFGARPMKADGESPTFGQQISAFVHALQSADQDGEDQDEVPAEECDTDETPDEDAGETPVDAPGDTDQGGAEDSADSEDEDGTDACDTDEDADEDADQDESDEESEDSDQSENSGDSAFSNHGQCVAAVAHDPEAVGENGTHGWAVSEAARVTCWQEFADPDNADTDDGSENGGEDTDEDTDEPEASQHGASSDKPHGKSAEAHERKQDRGSGKPSWARMNAGSHGHGYGHGKGGSHH